VVIIDVPQLEDHAGIARSALRYADEIVIPCAPSPIEINRTTPVRDEIAEAGAARDTPARSAILLNRCVARANSSADARQVLEGLGYDVLATAVPRREVYAQSFGLPIPGTGREVWRRLASDLTGRCVPFRPVPSGPHRGSSPKPRRRPPRHGVLNSRARPGGPRSGRSRSGSPSA
jgi:hypothetical protein